MTTVTPPPTTPIGRQKKPAVSSDWRAYAACARVDPELFHPVGYSVAALQQTEQAKAICRRCPVRERCLQWAMDAKEELGVLGGLSEYERWQLRRKGRVVGAVPSGPAFVRCVKARDFIEEQIAANGSLRRVAEALGVSRDTVGKARRYYLSDAAALDAAAEEVQPA